MALGDLFAEHKLKNAFVVFEEENSFSTPAVIRQNIQTHLPCESEFITAARGPMARSKLGLQREYFFLRSKLTSTKT